MIKPMDMKSNADVPVARDSIDVILFDLGGVLVELGGVGKFMQWLDHSMSVKEMWGRWLGSPAVRRFEIGQTTADEFGAAIVREFALPVGAEEFVEAFTYWPRAPYPGVEPLLASLRHSYRLACFSNNNELHWERIRNGMGLGQYFESSFLSHLIGRLKPDKEAFEFVVDSLDLAPERILFLDDNQLNVEGARSAGMLARRTRGFGEVVSALEDLGIVARPEPHR
jgi:HAD superfamily hydrolase (TIGR01509 family)